MTTPVKKPPSTVASRAAGGGNGTNTPTRTPARASTPTSTTPSNGATAKNRTPRSGAPGTPLSARGAVKRPGATSNLSSSSLQDDAADDDARAETAALIQELKDRLQKAEAASEEFQKQAEVLQLRLDDAVQEQGKLEERLHEEEERVEGLENEKKETVRQRRELESIYEAERAASMKEKEEASSREEEMQEIIQRLKDGLSQRDLKPTSEEEGRMSRTPSFRNNSRNNSSPNLENGFAPPASLQRSNSRGSSKLLLQKDKIIESLRLELAEAQIKVVEMEHSDGGRVQDLERVLLETRMTNARLLEENESFQLLLREKTLNGDFTTEFARNSTDLRPPTRDLHPSSAGTGLNLADELEGAEDDGDVNELSKRLETELRESKEQNKALTLYINKIIERVLQHQGFESVLDKNDLEGPGVIRANTDKELPPPPPEKENTPASFLQRAKSTIAGQGRRPRPMSMMGPPVVPQQTNVNEDPNTAPSIPLGRSNSKRMSTTGVPQLHRRSTSEWPAAAVVSNMYRGPSATPSGPSSPGLSSPRNSFFGLPVNPGANAGSRVPSGASLPRASTDENRPPSDSTAGAETVNTDSSPPRSLASAADRPGGAVMGGNKIRPLRLVQEAAEADAEAKKANRGSWIAGWFGKPGPGEGGA